MIIYEKGYLTLSTFSDFPLGVSKAGKNTH